MQSGLLNRVVGFVVDCASECGDLRGNDDGGCKSGGVGLDKQRPSRRLCQLWGELCGGGVGWGWWLGGL